MSNPPHYPGYPPFAIRSDDAHITSSSIDNTLVGSSHDHESTFTPSHYSMFEAAIFGSGKTGQIGGFDDIAFTSSLSQILEPTEAPSPVPSVKTEPDEDDYYFGGELQRTGKDKLYDLDEYCNLPSSQESNGAESQDSNSGSLSSAESALAIRQQLYSVKSEFGHAEFHQGLLQSEPGFMVKTEETNESPALGLFPFPIATSNEAHGAFASGSSSSLSTSQLPQNDIARQWFYSLYQQQAMAAQATEPLVKTELPESTWAQVPVELDDEPINVVSPMLITSVGTGVWAQPGIGDAAEVSSASSNESREADDAPWLLTIVQERLRTAAAKRRHKGEDGLL
ncbi:hypothetical protein OC861_001757 [Tilletia horrida]|nr:hypothetical protein OC861_001757 [Tilletia horrida]